MTQDKNKYITLPEAARLCSYSEPYLRLRARQGKLKSIKMGKKWVTTVAWLGDYERRVQEWRENSEAKKEKNYQTVFVGAPAAISQVVASKDGSGGFNGENKFLPAPDVDAPAALPPAASEPRLLTPRRRLPSMPSGQIYPVPKQIVAASVPENLGWFGAVVFGALCALALFIVADPASILKFIDPQMAAFDQANTAQVVVVSQQSEASLSGAIAQTEPRAVSPVKPPQATMGNDPLEEMVEAISQFIKRLSWNY